MIRKEFKIKQKIEKLNDYCINEFNHQKVKDKNNFCIYLKK